MTALLVLVALALLAGCLTLLCHPLLRFLRVPEVPAALLIACAGRSYRRRLAFVLRSRRESYLEDIAGLPPEYLWVVLAWRSVVTRLAALVRRPRPVPPPEKKLAPVPLCKEHLAEALRVNPGLVSVRRVGAGPGRVTVTREASRKDIR